MAHEPCLAPATAQPTLRCARTPQRGGGVAEAAAVFSRLLNISFI